ncbi:MAG: hypothetical protein Q7J68_02240 [Thermoplasmata archaeon]|nr:hypothetical protein [Thermoplasmata archaeon]
MSQFHNRNLKDGLIDQLITLYVGKKIKEMRETMGIVKLQKILFLSQSEMEKDKVNGLHHVYVRDAQGARSIGVYRDRGVLSRAGLYTEEYTEITKRGIEYVSYFEELFDKNQAIMDYVNGVLHVVGHMNSKQITDYGHEYIMQYGGQSIKVEDIAMGEEILIPLSDEESDIIFEMSDEWVESIRAMLNPDYMAGYEQVVQEMKSDTYLTHKEVFGHEQEWTLQT